MQDKKDNTVPRPLVLEMRDAKEGLVKCVNDIINRGIPCCILRPILEEILTSVKNVEKAEIAAAEKQYADALSESEKEHEK